jgi:hypothetical protein
LLTEPNTFMAAIDSLARFEPESTLSIARLFGLSA